MNLQLVIGILSLGFVCYYFMFALCYFLFSLSIVLLSRYLIRFAAPCYSHYSQSHVANLSMFHLISPTVLPEVPHDLSACYHRVVFVKTRLLPSTTPSGSSSLNHRVVFVKTRFLPSTAPPGATRVVLRTDHLLRPRRAAYTRLLSVTSVETVVFLSSSYVQS